MQRNDCFGCKTHFEEGAKLPLEGICVQLKNYPIPIKDQSHKYKLLRTICSFLNSKGGTILIGAEDQTGEIKGVTVQRKDQDDFRIFIQQLTDRIQPKIDLSDREDILTQFVPIFNKGKFIGKHLVKILVKQGDPSELYCFSKKIQLQAVNDKKVEEYEIVYSCIRLNSGSIKQFKGYQLVQEAKKKASQPQSIHRCFHEECNPEPLIISMDILKIGFSKIYEIHIREILEQWFEKQLEKMSITNSSISFDQQNQMIVVEFEDKSDFTKAEDFVNKNILELNKNLVGICCFEKKDKFLDCILYENKQKGPEKQMVPNAEIKKKKVFIKKSQKQEETQEEKKEKKVEHRVEDDESQKEVKEKDQKNEKEKKQEVVPKKKYHKVEAKKQEENPSKPVQETKKEKEKEQKLMQVNSPQKEGSFNKSFSFTFTHINPKLKHDLKKFIDGLVKCKKHFMEYENTLEVFLPNLAKYEEIYGEIQENYGILNHMYGFKSEIKFGINTGTINIHNFEKNKGKQFVTYLKTIMGKDLKAGEIIRAGNQQVIQLSLGKAEACTWLDRLLVDKTVKTFQISGAEKNQKAKLKFYLICQNPSEFEFPEFFY